MATASVPTHPAPSNSSIAWALLFLLGAVALVWAGFHEMYTYDGLSDSDKIVGGDAYNYIIIGVRGLGFIGAGVVCALAAVCSLLMGLVSSVAALRA